MLECSLGTGIRKYFLTVPKFFRSNTLRQNILDSELSVRMADESLDEMPLRELFTEAERLTRELVDHIDLGFLPKINNLNRLTREDAGNYELPEIEDITIRNHAAQVLESERFTAQFYQETERYLLAIEHAVSKFVD